MQLDKSTVRRRVASFEALMHSNTTAFVACEAAYLGGGVPLGELQLQPQSTQLLDPTLQKADSLDSMSSSQMFMDLRPMQHFSSSPESCKPAAVSGQAPCQALECESKPASRGDRENIKPTAHSWQAGPRAVCGTAGSSAPSSSSKMAAGRAPSAPVERPHPPGQHAHQELEMVDTAADQPSSQEEEGQSDYSEVQIRIRLPRYTPNTGAGGDGRRCTMCGSTAEGSRSSQDSTIDRLREELAAKERERRHTAEALQRKQSECDNLSRVVRELAESRAQLVACRAVQSERIEELQAECMRIMRIADLSRTVSKENITKATQAKKHARQAEDEALQQKRAAVIVRDSNKALRLEVLELREKICLLERLPLLHHGGQSRCMQEFVFSELRETY